MALVMSFFDLEVGLNHVTKLASAVNLASVSLGRRDNMNTSGLTGLYRCVIPDRSGVDQTLIVGIYSSRKNSELNIPIFIETQITKLL